MRCRKRFGARLLGLGPLLAIFACSAFGTNPVDTRASADADVEQMLDSPASPSDGATNDVIDATDARVDAKPVGCNGVESCPRLVFVTSSIFVGRDVGGVTGADTKCQEVAKSSPLPQVSSRTFVAWISSNMGEASTRLKKGTEAYRRLDGAIVANDWTSLVGASASPLVNPIDRDEKNKILSGVAVWTGTAPDGTQTQAHCANWTIGTPVTGTRGKSDAVDGKWTQNDEDDCAAAAHLYCIEY